MCTTNQISLIVSALGSCLIAGCWIVISIILSFFIHIGLAAPPLLGSMQLLPFRVPFHSIYVVFFRLTNYAFAYLWCCACVCVCAQSSICILWNSVVMRLLNFVCFVFCWIWPMMRNIFIGEMRKKVCFSEAILRTHVVRSWQKAKNESYRTAWPRKTRSLVRLTRKCMA